MIINKGRGRGKEASQTAGGPTGRAGGQTDGYGRGGEEAAGTEDGAGASETEAGGRED